MDPMGTTNLFFPSETDGNGNKKSAADSPMDSTPRSFRIFVGHQTLGDLLLHLLLENSSEDSGWRFLGDFGFGGVDDGWLIDV